MQNDTSEILDHPYITTLKVHRLSCLELKKFIDRITQIFTAIESARPGCTSGIQALCTLQVSMEEIALLLRQCSESSKLYLAITGYKIVRRCERIRNSLESCLSQIQNMVPTKLADQISRIVDDLRIATFTIESSEEEAGKILLALLHQGIALSRSPNVEEVKAFKSAALRLHITSPIAVLIEKRSIRKLLGKIHDTNPTKKKILNYFLYLMRKYGQSTGAHMEKARHEAQGDGFDLVELPEKFKCPLSRRLMSDPVIIANGHTFERLWIQRWFNEGHKTCPKTRMELSGLFMTPNVELKDLISKWCVENGIIYFDPCLHTTYPPELNKFPSSGSIASCGSSLAGLSLQFSNVSFRSSDTNGVDFSDANAEDEFGPDLLVNNEKFQRFLNLSFLANLSELPWASRRKAVEDVKNQLKDNKESHSTISTSYIKPLIRYLKDAHHFRDSGAKRDGAELILIFLRECRSEVPPLPKDAFYVLSSFLDSEITEEVLSIMEMLSNLEHYKSEIVASGVLSYILEILENPNSKHHFPAMRVLCNFSAQTDLGQHMIYLDYIPKLVPFLDELILAGCCLKIFRNLCNIDEAGAVFVESENCITSIGELLEVASDEEQELAIDFLLSLCDQREEYRELLMQEHIISHLVNISINGNSRGKLDAIKLLQLLNNVSNDHSQECTILNSSKALDISISSSDSCGGKISSPKSSGFFSRKILKLTKLGR